MLTRLILDSHPASTLKKEISKTNIKGYSKMTKKQLLDVMMANKERFSHIKKKEYVPPKRTAPKKAEPPKKVMAKPKADTEPKRPSEPKRPAPKKKAEPKRPAPKKKAEPKKKKTAEEERRDKLNKMTPEELMNALPDVAKRNVQKFLPDVYEQYKELYDKLYKKLDEGPYGYAPWALAYRLNQAMGIGKYVHKTNKDTRFDIEDVTPKGIADAMTKNGISADELKRKMDAFKKKLNDKKYMKGIDIEKFEPKTREILNKGPGEVTKVGGYVIMPVSISPKLIFYFEKKRGDVQFERTRIGNLDYVVDRLLNPKFVDYNI